MNGDLLLPIVVAVISSGVLTTGVNLWFSHDRNEADTSAVLVDATNELIEPLTRALKAERATVSKQGDRIRGLENRFREMGREVGVLREGVRRLSAQLESLGHEPVWTPPENADTS